MFITVKKVLCYPCLFSSLRTLLFSCVKAFISSWNLASIQAFSESVGLGLTISSSFFIVSKFLDVLIKISHLNNTFFQEDTYVNFSITPLTHECVCLLKSFLETLCTLGRSTKPFMLNVLDFPFKYISSVSKNIALLDEQLNFSKYECFK